MNKKRLINYNEVRELFNKEFKETMQLIEDGETHLDNLAEGFTEADRVLFKLICLSPMTNADHIRSMTDEELCDFILDKRENGHCFNDRCYFNDTDKGCDDCTMEWLKQPYEKKGENND